MTPTSIQRGLVAIALAFAATPCWAPYSAADQPTEDSRPRAELERSDVAARAAGERDMPRTLMPRREPVWRDREVLEGGAAGGPAATTSDETVLGTVPPADSDDALAAGTFLLVIAALLVIAGVIWTQRRKPRFIRVPPKY